jgi:hypothetical protein
MAQYKQARSTLTKVGTLTPSGLAFLAMTHQRLGEHEQARATLTRLREITAKYKETDELTVFLWREAEALLREAAPAKQ